MTTGSCPLSHGLNGRKSEVEKICLSRHLRRVSGIGRATLSHVSFPSPLLQPSGQPPYADIHSATRSGSRQKCAANRRSPASLTRRRHPGTEHKVQTADPVRLRHRERAVSPVVHDDFASVGVVQMGKGGPFLADSFAGRPLPAAPPARTRTQQLEFLPGPVHCAENGSQITRNGQMGSGDLASALISDPSASG